MAFCHDMMSLPEMKAEYSFCRCGGASPVLFCRFFAAISALKNLSYFAANIKSKFPKFMDFFKIIGAWRAKTRKTALATSFFGLLGGFCARFSGYAKVCLSFPRRG